MTARVTRVAEVELDAAPTFQACVLTCLGNADFMAEYRRLTGAKIGLDTRSLLDRLVDRVTGNRPPPLDPVEARAFFVFVLRHIWLPVVTEHAEAIYLVRERAVGGAA